MVSIPKSVLESSFNYSNEGVISVTAGRFPGASDEPLHSLLSLQGLIWDANPLEVAQPPLQSSSLLRPIRSKNQMSVLTFW